MQLLAESLQEAQTELQLRHSLVAAFRYLSAEQVKQDLELFGEEQVKQVESQIGLH